MRVIDEPLRDIRPPRLKATRRRLPHQRLLARGQVPADRLAVPARVPADRRLIPATRSQSMYLHVVLLCEHPHRSLSLVIASEPTTVRGTPDRPRAARGDSGSRGGYPPRLPQNRTYAVRIRLFGTAGYDPRRRPVFGIAVIPIA